MLGWWLLIYIYGFSVCWGIRRSRPWSYDSFRENLVPVGLAMFIACTGTSKFPASLTVDVSYINYYT